MSEGQGRPRPRIESLADLIFGLSLSIGALALIASPPSSPADIDSHILAFAFTFMLLITSWIIYTADMSVLPVHTRLVTFLNVVLLMMVAIVPYLLNNVEFSNPALGSSAALALKDYASSLFGIDLAGIIIILAIFSHILAMEEKQLVAPEVAKTYRGVRNLLFFLAALLLVSLAPVFWTLTLLGVPLRLYMWYIPILVYWVRRLREPSAG